MSEDNKKPAPKNKLEFRSVDGSVADMEFVSKFYRDVLEHHLGSTVELVEERKEKVLKNGEVKVTVKTKERRVVTLDVENPLGGRPLKPGADSPICAKCKLYECASNPFIDPSGAADPLLTVVVDSVSRGEDSRNELSSEGPSSFLKKLVAELGFDLSRVRWSPATRCYGGAQKTNFATKGNWCKHFLVDDLRRHPPKLILPVGTASLGLLCHKSSAQDWSGKLLTYRGWPDDWLTDREFCGGVLSARPSTRVLGHPLFGEPPGVQNRIAMVPVQAPRIVYGTQNPHVISQWKNEVKFALECATQELKPNSFDRPWWKISTDPAEIKAALSTLISNPGTLVSYDTETNGLKPWLEGAAIVFMMFRWKLNGVDMSIGFPWNYFTSPLLPHLEELSKLVLEALYVSRVVGHNITFDILFTAANVPGADLDRL
mgnify:CR=1 FL=1